MRLIFVFFLTCLPLAAQAKTWIVDGNGSGQFTDIQPAVDAANRGDRIHVLPGIYSSVQINKGLILTADQGAKMGHMSVPHSWLPASLQVTNLPSTDLFVCAGLNIEGHVSISGCAGRVHFQSLQIERASFSGIWSGPPTTIANSQATSFHTVSISGTPSVINSTTSFESCTLTGWIGGTYPNPLTTTPGLTISNGKVTITGGSVHGENGWVHVHGCAPESVSPSVGLDIVSGSVSITSGALIEGGDQIVIGVGYGRKAGAMDIGSAGTAIVDPSVSLVLGVFGKQPQLRTIPALVVAAPTAGTTIAARIEATAGTAVGLLVSFAGRPAFSQFGALWMSSSVLIPLGSGRTASTGDWSVSVPMSGTLHPKGSTFTLQGIVTGQAGLELTTPATITVM